ncbi:DUF6377 domain-containing protein [Botryobacter ruber]|uniref:DUF6377 domain-containing protein n=1 Tax=Botryobacter ruber TaxID=2171629 RepID=UPI000E0AD177|nr:DUF6377 domain-containing protein [Botryobacter ruber]
MNYSAAFFSFIFLFLTTYAFAQPDTDSVLNELSNTIEHTESYHSQKLERIGQLKDRLQKRNISALQRFELYNKLTDEYAAFKYDSAFTYARKLQAQARALEDPVLPVYAKTKLGFILVSSGMFKESLDSLKTINVSQMPDSIKARYFSLMARAYYDLADYNSDFYYSDVHTAQGNRYIDSVLALQDTGTAAYYSTSAFKNYKTGNLEAAEKDVAYLLKNFRQSYHDQAIAAALLGLIYKDMGEKEKAIRYLAIASIADIKSATTEAIALMNLAELLYNTGDESRAYEYIKQALEDATFYGARQRKIQVAAILPIIEGERLITVEGQRTRLVVYALVVTLLSVLVLVFAFIIFRQLKQLRQAKRTVTEANTQLQEVNESLVEANRIKEEYIGYSFNMYSEYIDKMEKFKKALDKKLMAKKYDEINHVMKSLNLKKEREALYLSFDRIFLKLFPNFIAAFNSLFDEENRVVSKDDQALTIEQRIFALLRIGIKDHEQIARILEYSVSTIYNYKTKAKNRSLLPNEEFEKRVMEIKAF